MTGIGVNLRVTGHCSQGGRKYMEDTFSVAYQQTEDLRDLEYAYFGIFDGHGGPEAALYAKDHLIDKIVSEPLFWSEKDEDVLRSIHIGFLQTHYSMWREHENWPLTSNGFTSTSGTTATVAFIKRGKLFIGHVGDSCIVLGYQEKGEMTWKARALTADHKPETASEMRRITECGGKVVAKSGVPRVVWNRPRLGHRGPVRRSTPIDEIPFLAVARSLGDFWSYNSEFNKFVVSPEPDVHVYPMDVETFRCLILGTDGLWNMLTPSFAVSVVQAAENHNEEQVVCPPNEQFVQYNKDWLNPSKMLVDKAINRWELRMQRADNTSVVTLMLDPPGPPKAQLLINQKQFSCSRSMTHGAQSFHGRPPSPATSSGVSIFTRFPATAVPILRPLDSDVSGLNLNTENTDNSIQINEVSSSELDLTIDEEQPQNAEGDVNTCENRTCSSPVQNAYSYNFRYQRLSANRDDEDGDNSDRENRVQSRLSLRSTQSPSRKCKPKRRRRSYEKTNDVRTNPWNVSSRCGTENIDARRSSLRSAMPLSMRMLRNRNIDLRTIDLSPAHPVCSRARVRLEPRLSVYGERFTRDAFPAPSTTTRSSSGRTTKR